MTEYVVRFRRVVYVEAIIEADSSQAARDLVKDDPHEYMLDGSPVQDTTTVVGVRPRRPLK